MVISETRSRLQSLVYVGVSLSQPRGGMNITVAALANKVRWLDASPRLFSYIEKNIQLMMILEGMGIDAANQMTAKAFNDHFLQIIDILVVSIRILELLYMPNSHLKNSIILRIFHLVPVKEMPRSIDNPTLRRKRTIFSQHAGRSRNAEQLPAVFQG